MIKRIPANFTLGELMAYLRTEPDLDGYKSTREWAQYFEIREDKMRLVLKEAMGAGLLLRDKAMREAMDGRIAPVPVYAFDLGDEELGGVAGGQNEPI